MSVAHLICGPVGSGKTTYASALASRIRGVHFDSSAWASSLFVGDDAASDERESIVVRVARCEGLIWALATRLLALGTSVVLDVDLAEAAARDEWRARVAGTPSPSKLHFLDVGRETRLRRVLERNRRSAAEAATEEARFNQLDTRFESPTDDELYGAMILCED